MRGRVILAGAGLLTAAAFGLVLTQTSSVDKNGVRVGVKKAQASCHDEGLACLPSLDVVDTAGTRWNRETLAGKVVLVNFWATWCQPCVAEIPELSAAYERLGKDGLVVLGMMADSPTESSLRAFVDQVGLRYPVVRADEDTMRAFDYPDALPTTLVYDRTGHLAFTRVGALRQGEIEPRLRELLDKPVP